MGFSNPRTPWSQLAQRLEGKQTSSKQVDRKQVTDRQTVNRRSVDEHADGSDAPAFSRPDRHQVSVGPGGSDGVGRYSGPGQGPILRTSTVEWA
ncbi:MAG: hypothetical protein L0K10_08305, partial [Brevibacterium aurantiacum]|nr:hypothetical protein [Brevibacterium aurantiacum]